MGLRVALPCTLVSMKEADLTDKNTGKPYKRVIASVSFTTSQDFFMDPADPRVADLRKSIGESVSLDVEVGRDGQLRLAH